MPSPSRPNPANGPDFGIDVKSLISLSVMPWLMFQSDGHLEVSSLKPPAPLKMFLLPASCPNVEFAVAFGMTSPGLPLTGLVSALDAGAVVVAPALTELLFLLLLHAALSMAS